MSSKRLRYASLELHIYEPDHGPEGTVYGVHRAVPVERVLDNTTQNYQLLVAELGDMIWKIGDTLRRANDHHR